MVAATTSEPPSGRVGLPFDGSSPFSPAPGAAARGEPAQGRAERNAMWAYGRLPLSFEPNMGQTDRRARFLSRGRGYTLFLTRKGAVLSLAREGGEQPASLRMGFEGASERAGFVAADELPGKANYFVGNRRSRWRTNVPTYAKVRRRELYPGVDVVYYGRGRRLEYDFNLAPGADPAQIVLRFGGAKPRLARNGDLVLRTGGERVRQLRPVAYQRVGGKRRAVRSRYELLGGGRVALRVGRFDRERPLVIDPVLLYSTYLGGNGDDEGRGIAVDAAGNAYVTGSTASTDFPRQNAEQATYGGDVDDAFVTKFNPSGSVLVYSTYLGGSGGDHGAAIAVDGAGNAYVTGTTSSSTTFPLQSPEQAMFGGARDAFVSKFNATGSAHLFSTFLGGLGSEAGLGIALDGARNIYATGNTGSTNFPTQNPEQPMSGGGSDDAFVTKYNSTGSARLYSTYLGGSGHDAGAAVAVDGAGNAHVIGETTSTNFPTQAPKQAMNGGGTDAFVTKYNSAGSARLYSTYLGGSAEEYGIAGAVDGARELYVAGYTESANFPTQTPEQPTRSGFSDAFVTKFNLGGSAHRYSTYLGGSGDEAATAVAVDAAGNAYVAGLTRSTNFPLQNPFQPMHAGSTEDAFVTRFNAAGTAHVTSSYLGGSGSDRANAIALDGAGNAYLTGQTESTDFPVRAAAQPSLDEDAEAFVSKIGEPPAVPQSPLIDRTAPVLSRLRLSPAVFRAASRGASIAQRRHRARTRVSYRLSEAATVTFRVQRAAKGRRVRGRCRRPTRANRNRRRCVRYVLLRGSFTHDSRAGANRLRFTGRLRRRKLRPGTYRLRARAVDAAGNASPFARRKFRIVRR